MTTNEKITLGISLLSLGVSVYAIYQSRKWSIEAWRRNKRLPYYRELNKFLKGLYKTFYSDELGVYRRPDFSDHINTANSLGLRVMENRLEMLDQLLTNTELYKDDLKYKKHIMSGSFRDVLDEVYTLVQKDISRLTRSSKDIAQ